MGTDKATLNFNGQPLWSRQLGVLRELEPKKVLISGRARPAWLPADIEVVLDESPSRGPLSGLAAALKTARTTHLLALAVDLPRMTSAHLAEIWKFAKPDCGVIPVNGDHLETLCAIYSVTGSVIAASNH